MECPPIREGAERAHRERWLLGFSVDGDLRFISHHDTLRLFRRALARAALPVRYTQGYNPHPRISIPLPRPVGVSSQAEAILIEFDGPIDGDEVSHKLDEQTPSDITMHGARRLGIGEQPQPDLVRYRLEPDSTADPNLATRARELLAAGVINLDRVDRKNGRTRSIDVRPFLKDILIDGGDVVLTLCVTGGGTVKAAEIAGLLGFDPTAINHRIHRIEVQWR